MTAAAILREIIADAAITGWHHDVATKTLAALAQVERDETLMEALIAEHDAVTRCALAGRLSRLTSELASARHHVNTLLEVRELEAQATADPGAAQ